MNVVWLFSSRRVDVCRDDAGYLSLMLPLYSAWCSGSISAAFIWPLMECKSERLAFSSEDHCCSTLDTAIHLKAALNSSGRPLTSEKSARPSRGEAGVNNVPPAQCRANDVHCWSGIEGARWICWRDPRELGFGSGSLAGFIGVWRGISIITSLPLSPTNTCIHRDQYATVIYVSGEALLFNQLPPLTLTTWQPRIYWKIGRKTFGVIAK